MISMAEENTIKRSYVYDVDVVEAFDAWTDQSGMKKNPAAQLGMWLVMQLDPSTRQTCMDLMSARKEIPEGAVSLTVDPGRAGSGDVETKDGLAAFRKVLREHVSRLQPPSGQPRKGR